MNISAAKLPRLLVHRCVSEASRAPATRSCPRLFTSSRNERLPSSIESLQRPPPFPEEPPLPPLAPSGATSRPTIILPNPISANLSEVLSNPSQRAKFAANFKINLIQLLLTMTVSSVALSLKWIRMDLRDVKTKGEVRVAVLEEELQGIELEIAQLRQTSSLTPDSRHPHSSSLTPSKIEDNSGTGLNTTTVLVD
ncbi:hypothetical protein M427DRAFT_143494, partial [Gonapodya prolifera JEL478]